MNARLHEAKSTIVSSTLRESVHQINHMVAKPIANIAPFKFAAPSSAAAALLASLVPPPAGLLGTGNGLLLLAITGKSPPFPTVPVAAKHYTSYSRPPSSVAPPTLGVTVAFPKSNSHSSPPAETLTNSQRTGDRRRLTRQETRQTLRRFWLENNRRARRVCRLT